MARDSVLQDRENIAFAARFLLSDTLAPPAPVGEWADRLLVSLAALSPSGRGTARRHVLAGFEFDPDT
jgi:hypothetical protein